MADFDSMAFRSNVLKTLTDPTVSVINFSVHGHEVVTMCYYFMAKYIHEDKLKCVIGNVSNGTAAEYDAADNTIYGKESAIIYYDQMATIIHECTHAYFDLVKGFKKDFSINILWNEVVAFLAGQIFTVANRPFDMVSGNSDPNIVAYNIVKKKGLPPKPWNSGTKMIDFSEDDVKPLVDCLRGHALYKNRVDKASPIDGIN